MVFIENYLHEWRATINGKPSPILPAYGVFRSVVLEKGQNEVVFEYRPYYLIASLWISGIGCLVFLAVCLGWASIRRKKEGMEL
jgi:uncharacterized membrane protein YfhO